jgi:hypothetical protein
MTTDAYVLVHPEPFPSNDVWVMGVGAVDPDDCDWSDLPDWILDHAVADGFDDRYGRAVAAEAARHTVRIALLDDLSHDEYDRAAADGEPHDLTVDVPADGWDVRFLDSPVPPGAGGALDDLGPGDRATVAGFSRHDCVARVVAHLEAAGVDVTLHDVGTLPLTPDAADALAAQGR